MYTSESVLVVEYIASERDCIIVKSNQTAVETLLGSSGSALLRGPAFVFGFRCAI